MNINWPNIVTVARTILAFLVFGLLISGSKQYYLGFILTLIVIIGDYLDGQLARSLKQASVFGAWLDIAADRLIEICYWVVFSFLHWINPWIAIIFITRGILVDGIRSFAQSEGFTAFGEKTMMKSDLGKFLVSSRFSRIGYAACKAGAFSLIILAQSKHHLYGLAQVLVYISTFFCLIRGIPVLIEGVRFFKSN